MSTDLGPGVFKNHAARDGTCYVLTFTDHAWKYVTEYGLKKKFDAIKNLEKYIGYRLQKDRGRGVGR